MLDVALCSFCIRFFLERQHRTNVLFFFRHDIAILLTGICRFYSHQHEVCRSFARKFCQAANCFKIGVFHIRIDRADRNRFIKRDALHIVQIGADKRDGGKRIASARFH